MMPILGVPMVERVMQDLAAGGVGDFIVVHRPDDEGLVRHFEASSELHPRVRLIAQPRPLGMADALECAAPLILGDFVLSACDNLIDRQEVRRMIDRWRGSSSLSGLLAIMPVQRDQVTRSGVVEMKADEVTRIVEKPSINETESCTVSLPLYIFSTAILGYLQQVPCSERRERELQDAIQMLIDRNRGVLGYPVGWRLSLTSPSDLLEINKHYLKSYGAATDSGWLNAASNTRLIEPVLVEPGSLIGPDCVIGPNAYVEQGCSVGSGVIVHDSVVLRESVIPDGRTVVGEVMSPEGNIGMVVDGHG